MTVPSRITEARRGVPSVESVLQSSAASTLLARYPRWAVLRAIREALAARRLQLAEGGDDAPGSEALLTTPALQERILPIVRLSLRRVINATGVVLHTNLGRAPLSERAVAALVETGAGYCTVEYDPDLRTRGSRSAHATEALRDLTGAEAAVVVNNNAAAVLLTLTALAGGRRVVVSRGELVEIGGGFRVPDVMRAAGVELREVGTTNRTNLGDYVEAIDADTAMLLKVHRSNFSIVGFTEEVSVADLARVAAPKALPVVVDLGSGALVDIPLPGLPSEPTVSAVIDQGADLCTFSGDKLLGGPQAGLIVGRQALIDTIRKHPLMRALRPDKLTIAALTATLASYREGAALREIPTLRMLTEPLSASATRKDRLLVLLSARGLPLEAEPRVLQSRVGGGALPSAELGSWAVCLRPATQGAESLAKALAAGDPCVVGRIHDGAVALDLRTVRDDELAELCRAIEQAVAALGSQPT
jgi:L-seryl-tRNA(Ser) seleniumtransferase